MVSTGDPTPADSGTGCSTESTDARASPGPAAPHERVVPLSGSAIAGASPRPLEETLHELRSTVVALELASQVLAERHVSLPPARRRRLQRMHDSETARLERLLDGRPQSLVEVDLDEVVRPLVEGLRLRGHDVRWVHHDGFAVGRPDDIAEIVHILLENAVRHAPGTTIAIEPVAHVPGWTGVRVFDRGAGIAPGSRPRLFVRGERGPDSTGLGLGLNVAQRLASEMGGALVLEPTRYGTGASFRLTLPLGPAQAARA